MVKVGVNLFNLGQSLELFFIFIAVKHVYNRKVVCMCYPCNRRILFFVAMV